METEKKTKKNEKENFRGEFRIDLGYRTGRKIGNEFNETEKKIKINKTCKFKRCVSMNSKYSS